MKNKILFYAMLFIASMFSVQLNAQLEVLTSGDVKVSKNIAVGTNIETYTGLNLYKWGPTNSTTTYGIKSFIKMPACPIYSFYGIYAVADALNATSVHYPQPIVGVYGTAKKGEDIATFAAGVAGVAHHRGGIGVYGGINVLLTSLPANAKYAGYFNGTTKVNGTLIADLIVVNGDTLVLDNVRSLSREPSNAIDLLHPISYSIKSDTTLRYDEKAQQEMRGVHYGLVAQDVQKVLPEIVYERDGQKSINYIELIPLLIQRVQELSAEVEELKKQVKEIK